MQYFSKYTIGLQNIQEIGFADEAQKDRLINLLKQLVGSIDLKLNKLLYEEDRPKTTSLLTELSAATIKMEDDRQYFPDDSDAFFKDVHEAKEVIIS